MNSKKLPNSSKVIFIKEDDSVVAFKTESGAINNFFFSYNFLRNKFDLALENFINRYDGYKQTPQTNLALESGELTVIDLQKKKLFAINHYVKPGEMKLNTLKVKLEEDSTRKNIKLALLNELILFVDYQTQEKYPYSYFTSDAKINSEQIVSLVMNKNNNIYHLEPHNFNFDATYYTNLNEEQFCIDLHQNGLVLNQEDINAWYQYLDKHKMNVKKERIKNYFNTIKEKEDLEKMLNQTTVSNNKIKL